MRLEEPRRFERELELLLSERQVSAETPQLTLLEVKKGGGLPQIPLRFIDGAFRGFYRRPLPESFHLHLRGKVEMFSADKGATPYTRSARKTWRVRNLAARATSSSRTGINFVTAGIGAVDARGGFALESHFGTKGGLRSLEVKVSATTRKRGKLTATCILELVDLQGFLARVAPLEQSLVPSTLTHLEFVSALRKVFQGGPNDPLAPFFNRVLFRFRNVAPAVTPGGAEEAWLRMYAVLYFEGEYVDIGHVLTGIEGSPGQKPGQGQSRKDWLALWSPELIVTWEGDLGSALYAYAKDFANLKPGDPAPEMNDYLRQKAGRADLIGDLDGINLGARYDPSKSLSANLAAYYGSGSRKRFGEFLATTRANDGTAPLTLVKGARTPKLSQTARKFIAAQTHRFALAQLITDGSIDPKVDRAKYDRVKSVLEVDSPEMDLVVDYFVHFLENGLAHEARRP